MILNSNNTVDKYTVSSFIKEGVYDETYKITDGEGQSYFMKLYIPERIPQNILTKEGKIREIEICKSCQQDNLPSFIGEGSLSLNGVDYQYLITNYFSGELVADRIIRGSLFSVDETIQVISDILNALVDMHSKGIVHNDITPRNIMFDLRNNKRSAKLIDLGHTTWVSDNISQSITTEDLSPLFRAIETYYGSFSEKSDIFSLAAVAYSMLFGNAPWVVEIPSDCKTEKAVKTFLYKERKNELKFDDSIPEWFANVLSNALDSKPDNRYSASAMLKAIETNDASVSDDQEKVSVGPVRKAEKKEAAQEQHNPKGNGFADVAGMEDLKSELQHKVIFLLKHPEKARQYKLTPPNGMILYGPPGCGKTYFAEKFAEETGFNYKLVKTSDIGSTYIHGTQGKISELFNEARNNAPFVICFDEFDAMAPKRTGTIAGEHQAGEVNEFLSQLNNCGKDGVFVVATTNQIGLIDEAILRKGRIDLHFNIPYPDLRTRKLMFELYLKDRPCEEIDTDKLAELTEDYVASEIAYIVNDAAMQAAFADVPISQETLVQCIKNTPPGKMGAANKKKIGF